ASGKPNRGITRSPRPTGWGFLSAGPFVVVLPVGSDDPSRDCASFPARSSGGPDLKAITFDVDAESLESLRQAFPEWQIEVMAGAAIDSLTRDWSPEEADLLVVGVRDSTTETLGLCRGLRSQVGRAHTPLLVLVPRAQEVLVRVALAAGASSCLLLPVHV